MKVARAIRGVPRYVRDYLRFRKSYSGRLEFRPYLTDWYEEGGNTRSDYFWQDLLVARMIFKAKPEKHVDIGSRVDGFVAHVASFRDIEVIDVRPITTNIPGIIFKQADLTKPIETMKDYCDSLSCLHALEHFGLGRYGDPIDTNGFEHGFVNMTPLLKKSGTFYLSVPIGIPRVEFNAHRVLDPQVIIDLAANNALQLSAFTLIKRHNIQQLEMKKLDLAQLASQRYSLGVFTFVKTK